VKALEEAGLTGVIKTRNSAKTQGTVVATDPKAGTEIEEGGSVTLFVPKALIEVPSVMGLTEEDAKAQLQGAGLKVRVVPQASNEVPEGTVVQQNPGEGAKVASNTAITIVVSTGPPDQPTDGFPTDQPTDDFPTDEPTDDFPTDEPTDDNPIGDDGLGGDFGG
jgi:serine/threonine-protein kinase